MAKKKLEKKIDEQCVKITAIEGNLGEQTFDFTALPPDIQSKLGPFGLSHKLGDAAAGKAGAEAEEAINKVWEGLMNSDWSVRAPAAPKVSTKVIADNYGNLSPEDQDAAAKVLIALGIKIPGITPDAEPAPEEAGGNPE